MAERVVDLLEPVQIEEDDRAGRAASALGAQPGRELKPEAAAVQQPREGIVVGEVLQLVLEPVALRDVLDLEHQIAGRARCAGDERHADASIEAAVVVAQQAHLLVGHRQLGCDERVDAPPDVRDRRRVQQLVEVGPDKALATAAELRTQRAVDLQQRPEAGLRELDQGHPDRPVLERAAEARRQGRGQRAPVRESAGDGGGRSEQGAACEVVRERMSAQDAVGRRGDGQRPEQREDPAMAPLPLGLWQRASLREMGRGQLADHAHVAAWRNGVHPCPWSHAADFGATASAADPSP